MKLVLLLRGSPFYHQHPPASTPLHFITRSAVALQQLLLSNSTYTMPSGQNPTPAASTSGAQGAQAPGAGGASTPPTAVDPPSPSLTLEGLASLNTTAKNPFDRWYSQEHQEEATVYYKG
ncbi:Protein of unknown function [Pyronema omphalodes CBS 100304]|uniref:Uncharacterized protein n=1 Tax=Pyronema omphalodes (strain CBS 100304) TaxID=1076935 RepID=U4LS19_PYROM|nr:Protein of unknown function [Pyronema omphalodes CBS 100304]